MGILSVALAVLMDGTLLATSTKSDVRQVTRATLLARAVMTEIEHKLIKDGFGSFDRSEACDFRVEGLKEFSCEYTVKKVELPVGDLIQRLFTGPGGPGGALAGLAGAGAAGAAGLAGAASSALSAPGGARPGGAPGAAAAALGANPGVAANALQLYSAQMQAILEEALREVRLTITWPVGKKKTESLTVVTHLVEIGRAGVSGVDQLAGQISQQLGLQAPTPGQTPTAPATPGGPGFVPPPPTFTPYVGTPPR